MCYAFRDWVIKRMNGGEHYYSDIFHDDYIELNNVTNVINNVNEQLNTATNAIDNVNKQLETKQKELGELIKQYKLIIETYPVIDFTVPLGKLIFSDSVSDTKTGLQSWSKIPDILVKIQKTYSDVRRLKKSERLLTDKTKPLETNVNRLDSFLHKDLTRIDTILKPPDAKFYIQSGGHGEDKYKRKYLKYKMKYIQLKNTLKI